MAKVVSVAAEAVAGVEKMAEPVMQVPVPVAVGAEAEAKEEPGARAVPVADPLMPFTPSTTERTVM